MNGIKIALGQINPLVGDVIGNAERIIEVSRQARDEKGADLVVFPELALTGYPPEDLLLRPELMVWVERGLALIRQQVHGIDVLVGFPEGDHGALYNMAAVIRDGEIKAKYRKQHLPNYAVFDEKRYFAPGSQPCVVDVAGVAVGITICEDIWMPGPAAKARDAGAEVIVTINASPFHTQKPENRVQTLAQRTEETGLPIIYLNTVGGQDELVFDGGSLAMGAGGELILRAPACEEALPLVAFDRSAGLSCPEPDAVTPQKDLAGMAYDALVLGVRDYARKNGFRGAVMGLSGGIDSALTLAVAVDALGAENVEAVMMPSRYTARISLEDAEAEARALGVDYRSIPVEPAFNAFLGMLESEFEGTEWGVTEENIQARSRGVVLMAISNKTGRILLSTGNKSEMAVGYATLYGDMAGGFAVLKDVPKMLVYKLAHYRNRNGEVIPQRVIDRPPSAELAEDQQDTDSLPAYPILDRILELYIEQDRSVEDIVAEGFEEDVVRQIIRMVNINEYKRRQAPPGVRITRRAFGRDRRYPITSGFGRQSWPPKTLSE